ncbi:MAG: hypothetical protein MOB07_23215 [Acidobacteria bacterium]|nr:hypothetical protein [Acidobacteriota bacterium]
MSETLELPHASKTIQLHVDGSVTDHGQAPTDDGPKLYPLDQNTIDVKIFVAPDVMIHTLRRPNLGELIERDAQTPYETEEISQAENRFRADDETANARLWDKIALNVKGYRLREYKADQLIVVTPDVADLIPDGHKSAAFRGLYETKFELERDEGEGFVLGKTSYTVKQIFQAYEIRHHFRTPAESERREFRNRKDETRFATGSRKIKTKMLTHLKAYVELYDKLFVAIDRATINDEIFTDRGQAAAFLKAIDPIWKRGAVNCLMSSFEASLGD